MMTTREIKQALRDGEYAWPGGYQRYFVASDGAALSFEAVRDELFNVFHSTKYGINDGWALGCVAVNWDDADLLCSHTGEPISAAYN